ncbi:MAG: AlpA family phage regulatory protein [Deltaproteobacteria bacterium]|nr:AlpA family phage regulatory protein [Deltaproteobacteria bacterium]
MDRFITLAEVVEITTLRESAIYRMIQAKIFRAY